MYSPKTIGILNSSIAVFFLVLITGCTETAEPPIHPEGWDNPDDLNFHGLVLRTGGWGFNRCQSCHGKYLESGSSGLACNSCHVHTDGISSCTTCHGDRDTNQPYPPEDLQGRTDPSLVTIGAHDSHMDSDLSVVSCNQCHVVPGVYLDEGHLGPDNIAEITFGLLATHDGEMEPVWNRNEATCSSVYCHKSIEPKWTTVDGTYSSCGTCHSLPPAEGAHEVHAVALELDCSACHEGYSSVSETVTISTHINGERDIDINEAIGGVFDPDTKSCSGVRCHGESNTTPGWADSGEFTCVSCHGGQENQTAAPPSDLNGNNNPTMVGVGAHTVHLNGSEFSDGAACNECHVVPDSVLSAGHIDSDLTAEVTWGNLATDDFSIVPIWERGTASCSSTYCHGNFSYNDVLGNIATSVWTRPGSVMCGSCHGIPPTGHSGDYTLEECSDCHSSVVNSSGEIIDKTKHVNGESDF